MKPLIIGEAPSKNEVTERPIEGRIGKRLAKLAGLTLPEFLEHFERVNLLRVRQDTAEHGFQFNAEEARKEAAILLMVLDPKYTPILLLGHRVGAAFGCSRAYFMPQQVGRWMNVHVLPHPSGVNRWWNDRTNEFEAKWFMRAIVEKTR